MLILILASFHSIIMRGKKNEGAKRLFRFDKDVNLKITISK